LLLEIWNRRDDIGPRPQGRCIDFANWLMQFYRVGPFLAAQVILHIKAALMPDASDRETFALRGPGSSRFMCRVKNLPQRDDWELTDWYRQHVGLYKGLKLRLAEAGITIDSQDAQSCECEGDKAERWYQGEAKGKKFKPSAEPLPGETTPVMATQLEMPLTPADKPPSRAKQAKKAKPAAAAEPEIPAIASRADLGAVPAHIDVPPIAPVATRAEPHCLQAALDYAARGWAIFPVPIGTKKSHWKAKPGEARWGATKDADRIRRAYTQWPSANLGLPTDAANGFWVLDADTIAGHGKDGIGGLAALVAEHGPLPDTLRAESPTGSQHWYFRHPKDGPIRLQTGWREGIDVKGEGGMVLAPPSRKGTEAYRWVCEAEIAEAPAWLLRLVQATGASTGGAESTDIPAWITEADAGRGAESEELPSLAELEAAVAAIPNGSETDRDQWVAIGMAIKACRGGEDGFAIFDTWSAKWPGYDAGKTREAWEGFKPKRTGFGKLKALAWETNPDWRAKIEPPPAEPGTKPKDAKSAKQTDLEEWDAGELLCGELPPPRQWLTARQFCRGFVSSVVAPGGIGKTTFRLTQAIELATGRSLLGWPIHQRCRVLVVCFEDDKNELHRRLLAICRHHKIDPAELNGWLRCRELRGVKLAELVGRGARATRQVGPISAFGGPRQSCTDSRFRLVAAVVR
jgi:hypothetical protein